MVKNKKIIAIDLAFVVGTLLIALLAFGYYDSSVVLLGPEGEIDETFVLFEIVGEGDILIDDNLDFTSPDVYRVKKDLVIRFEPGTYYWRFEHGEIKKFTIESRIDLRLRESNGGFEVVNAGNVPLDVDVYENGEEFKERVRLGVGESVGGGDKFIGGQNE